MVLDQLYSERWFANASGSDDNQLILRHFCAHSLQSGPKHCSTTTWAVFSGFGVDSFRYYSEITPKKHPNNGVMRNEHKTLAALLLWAKSKHTLHGQLCLADAHWRWVLCADDTRCVRVTCGRSNRAPLVVRRLRGRRTQWTQWGCAMCFLSGSLFIFSVVFTAMILDSLSLYWAF